MELQHQISLLPFNTFKMDVRAASFVRISKVEELNDLPDSNNVLVLGGGSNVLFTRDFEGLVIHNAIKGIAVVEEDEQSVHVVAGAGENWHAFVIACVEAGRGGIENLALIPGTVGAAPIQNIGAYGAEVKDTIEWVSYMDLASRSIKKIAGADCAFGYRSSIFKAMPRGSFVILEVCFRLQKNASPKADYAALRSELERRGIAAPSLKDIADAVIAVRQSKLPDPKEIGNAGSFFKNPVVDEQVYEAIKQDFPNVPSFPAAAGNVKIPAGWLSEQCGFKGKQIGRAGVHPLQALVLVNLGNASGQEIWELSETIVQTVQARFNITLEREVQIL